MFASSQPGEEALAGLPGRLQGGGASGGLVRWGEIGGREERKELKGRHSMAPSRGGGAGGRVFRRTSLCRHFKAMMIKGKGVGGAMLSLRDCLAFGVISGICVRTAQPTLKMPCPWGLRGGSEWAPEG